MGNPRGICRRQTRLLPNPLRFKRRRNPSSRRQTGIQERIRKHEGPAVQPHHRLLQLSAIRQNQRKRPRRTLLQITQRCWAERWLASKKTACLAKPVRKKMGSRIQQSPPAPASHAPNAAAGSFGVAARGVPCLATGSSGGYVASAASGFPTLTMSRERGARLKWSRGWRPNH